MIERLAQILIEKKLMLAVAESCTGGLLAATLTQLAGASSWFAGGIISYSNAVKEKQLQVKTKSLARFGAVSQEVAIEMAEGVLSTMKVDIGLAITGVAGPDGGSEQKPVGTVCFAIAIKNNPTVFFSQCFTGDRQAVRKQAVFFIVEELLKII